MDQSQNGQTSVAACNIHIQQAQRDGAKLVTDANDI